MFEAVLNIFLIMWLPYLFIIILDSRPSFVLLRARMWSIRSLEKLDYCTTYSIR